MTKKDIDTRVDTMGNTPDSRTASANETAPRFTPGPWRWEVNLKSKGMSLNGGVPRFDLQVMDFVRWGMGGAAPRFLKRWDRSGLMVMEHASRFAVPVAGREHHSDWFRGIDHPDAHLIAAAPDLYAALSRYVEHYGDPLKVARAALAKADGRA